MLNKDEKWFISISYELMLNYVIWKIYNLNQRYFTQIRIF